ncbi:hypothetical protein ACFQU7_22405 [Pseudoroseomonas wenyumeiae]
MSAVVQQETGRMTLESLRAEVDGPRMMQDLAGLAQWVKLSGTPEEMEGIRFLQARLDAAGYRTQVLMHDAYISLPGPARVEVDGAPLTAITHSMSRTSGPNGVNGPLVDLGAGRRRGSRAPICAVRCCWCGASPARMSRCGPRAPARRACCMSARTSTYMRCASRRSGATRGWKRWPTCPASPSAPSPRRMARPWRPVWSRAMRRA